MTITTRSDRLAALLRMAPVFMLAAFLVACGGGGGGGDPAPVPVAPSITTQPASLSVQAGQTATFSVAAAGDAPLAYQWLRNSNAIAGAVQSSYTLASPTMADTNSRFAVRVSNIAGTVTSAEAVLTVTIPPAALPNAITLVKSNLGVVTAASVDAAGNTQFVRDEVAAGTSSAVARKLAPDGSLLPVGPSGQGLVVGPGPSDTPGNWIERSGAAFDAAGNVYLARSTFIYDGGIGGNFLLNGGSIARAAPDGVVTKLVEWAAGSVGAMAPIGLAIGADGTIYFVDQRLGNLVAWTAQSGARVLAKIRSPQENGFNQFMPYIVVTPDNKIYVMDRNLLKRVDGSTVTIVAGRVSNPPPGSPPPIEAMSGLSGTMDGTGSEALFLEPTAMVADAAGNLLVADLTTIRKVTPAGVVTTVAGIPAVSRSPDAGFPPLQEGPLSGSLGFQVGPIAIGKDGVVHAFVYPSAATYPGPSANAQQTLVKIRLQ